ncbi:DRTGG domain-containing protein [Shigella flexneri]
MLEHFRAGSLLVTSADRPDVLVAACLAAMNGVELRCPAADWRLRIGRAHF